MRNRWGFEYLVHRVGFGSGRVFPSKRLALQWAIRQQRGDWAVDRVWPSGHTQRITVIGGFFDDWPDDLEDDD